MSSFSTNLWSYVLSNVPNLPKGFEDFSPKEGKKAPATKPAAATSDSKGALPKEEVPPKSFEGKNDHGSSTKNSTDTGSERKKNISFGAGGNGGKDGSERKENTEDDGGSFNVNDPQNRNQVAAGVFIGTLLVAMLLSEDDSKEISFLEFRQLLEQGQVEKVIVLNKATAQVMHEWFPLLICDGITSLWTQWFT